MAAATPATTAADDDPSPRASGTRLRACIATGGRDRASATVRIDDETRSEPSVASSPAPSPSHETVGGSSVATTTSLHSSSARPKQSNPGPRFAEVAGTRTEGLRDGPLGQAWFAQPSALAAGGDRLWLVDAETSALRWVADGEVHTAVGEGLFEFGFVSPTLIGLELVFWLLMIVDAVQRLVYDTQYPRLHWLIAVLLTGVFGAVAYYAWRVARGWEVGSVRQARP